MLRSADLSYAGQNASTLKLCCAERPLDLQYDVVCLDPSRVLLVAHAALADCQDDLNHARNSVTMSFVLRKRMASDVAETPDDAPGADLKARCASILALE